MKLRYEAPKGVRIKHTFMGMTTFELGWWYNHDLNRWEYNPKMRKHNYGTHQPCRSVKAFVRKLKQAPRGVEFMLVSRWKEYDVYGKGSNDKIYENR